MNATFYDRDGRRTSTWDEYTLYQVQTNYAQDTSFGAGIDSVYKSATLIGGGTLNGVYSYFYDAFGRRRAKTTPWSTTDEYFYDTGHQMLSDRGSDTVGASATTFPEDDYVWLGGLPVALVRGRFNATTWVRSPDGFGTSCDRDSVAASCGTFMLVTDYLGKPVLMLDRGNTAGTASYEGFGYANRNEWRYGSPHNLLGSSTVTTIAPQIPPTFDATVRVLMSRSNFSTSSSVTLAGVVQSTLQGNRSHAWSSWQAGVSNTWPVVWNGTAADYGFDMEAYEVRAKQSGTSWAWTPLRYPGQYYDFETELNENWNRYYDPSTGRYLSPEPLLQSPQYVAAMAQSGMSVPTYAYAANNPLTYVDEDGLRTEPSPGSGSGGYQPGSGPGGGSPRSPGGASPRGPGPALPGPGPGVPPPSGRTRLPNGCPADRPVLFVWVPDPPRPPHPFCIPEDHNRSFRSDCDRLEYCLSAARGIGVNDPQYGRQLADACKKAYRCLLGFCEGGS